MKLSEIKKQLENLTDLNFQLPDGSLVPSHFHVTEVGMITKNFIDCGGTVRTEKVVNFQLWSSVDTDHRLKPQKLTNIISLSEKVLGIEDLDVEVEYQPLNSEATIGKFGLDFNGKNFVLTLKKTDCLAKDNCGIPVEKKKVSLSELTPKSESCCTPGGKCC
ncbi:MAG: DUF6428 family protein [Bacteroidia bacterium]